MVILGKPISKRRYLWLCRRGQSKLSNRKNGTRRRAARLLLRRASKIGINMRRARARLHAAGFPSKNEFKGREARLDQLHFCRWPQLEIHFPIKMHAKPPAALVLQGERAPHRDTAPFSSLHRQTMFGLLCLGHASCPCVFECETKHHSWHSKRLCDTRAINLFEWRSDRHCVAFRILVSQYKGLTHRVTAGQAVILNGAC